ncbi:MAG: hypothetical protein M0C28_23380 [Candidatus Moduliflexus flocculans]|nr:hypothetical protein [Candidatus Moduliflexus flocculans]
MAELHAKRPRRSLARSRPVCVSVIGRDRAKREAFAARWGISARASAAEALGPRPGRGRPGHDRPTPSTAPTPWNPAPRVSTSSSRSPWRSRPADCDAMIAAAGRERGKALGVVSQRRWYPAGAPDPRGPRLGQLWARPPWARSIMLGLAGRGLLPLAIPGGAAGPARAAGSS